MRCAFAGTPEFARVALAALLDAGLAVPLVLTQPDRPAGRGKRLQMSAVKQLAQAHAIEVAQPRSLRLDGNFADAAVGARERLLAARPDVLVVAAYGLLLPPWVLALPRLGCLNIHASLLPRWRGAAPIHRAIEAGDAHTGVTLMQMDAGLDTGAMLLAESIAIAPDDTTATLQDRLAALGGRLMVQALSDAAAGTLVGTPQPADGVTWAGKIEKAEAPIDWRVDAALIERRLRAFDPFPGASASIDGVVVKCWRGRVVSGDGAPGTLLGLEADGLRIACGQGALLLTELQRAGGRRGDARPLAQAMSLSPGMRFDLVQH
ncbi:MAG: methionyl-tRNA formyltransferase [Burkholderiaceae bacterium]